MTTVERSRPYDEEWAPPPAAVQWAARRLHRTEHGAWLGLPEGREVLARYEVDHENRRLIMRSHSVDVGAVTALHQHLVVIFAVVGYSVHREDPC